jgi:hypothetical protein
MPRFTVPSPSVKYPFVANALGAVTAAATAKARIAFLFMPDISYPSEKVEEHAAPALNKLHTQAG